MQRRAGRRDLSIGHREIRTLYDRAEVVEIDEQELLIIGRCFESSPTLARYAPFLARPLVTLSVIACQAGHGPPDLGGDQSASSVVISTASPKDATT